MKKWLVICLLIMTSGCQVFVPPGQKPNEGRDYVDVSLHGVDATGASATNTNLEALINSSPDGTHFLFSGTFKLADTVTITGKKKLYFHFHNSTITNSARIGKANFLFDTCEDITFEGGYVSGRESQEEIYSLSYRGASQIALDRTIDNINTGTDTLRTSTNHSLVEDQVIYINTSGATATTPAITGYRTVHVVDADEFQFKQTAFTDAVNITSAPASSNYGKSQVSFGDTPPTDDIAFFLRFDDCKNVEVAGVNIKNKDAFCSFTRCTNTHVHDNKFYGYLHVYPTEGLVLAPQNDNQDKQVLLTTYAVLNNDGYFHNYHDNYAERCAGWISSGTLSQTPRNVTLTNNFVKEYFDNGFYLSSGLYQTAIGNHFFRARGAGEGIKMRGHGNKIAYNNTTNGYIGYNMEGIGGLGTATEYYGSGSFDQQVIGNSCYDCIRHGLLFSDNQGTELYQYGALVKDNYFRNVGQVALTEGTGPAYGIFTSDPASVNKRTVGLGAGWRFHFENNTFDQRSIYSVTSCGNSGGFLTITFTSNNFLRIYERATLTLYDTSDATLNRKSHLVTAINESGVAALTVTTRTPYASTATGGYAQFPRNDVECVIGPESPVHDRMWPGHYIARNKFIGCRQCFWLNDLTDCDFVENVSLENHIVGVNSNLTISSMFLCNNVNNCRFLRNRCIPRGNRLIENTSGAEFYNNTLTDNDGYVNTSNASTTPTPNKISKVLFWLEPRFTRTTMSAGASNVKIGNKVAVNGEGVAAIDCVKTGIRFFQPNENFRPTLVTNQLNGQPVLRFDGTDDHLIFNGELANSNTGELFIVFKQSSTLTGGGNTKALLTTADWDGGTPNGSSPAVRYIIWSLTRNASNTNVIRMVPAETSTTTLVTATTNIPDNAYRLITWRSDGVSYDASISNGTGLAGLTAQSDGPTIGAPDLTILVGPNISTTTPSSPIVGQATLTTTAPHGAQVGTQIVVSGYTGGATGYNGTYNVVAVNSPTQFVISTAVTAAQAGTPRMGASGSRWTANMNQTGSTDYRDNFVVGGFLNGNTLAQTFQGDIACIIFCEPSLTPSERSDILSYIYTTYGSSL